jgi:hypothetical protein
MANEIASQQLKLSKAGEQKNTSVVAYNNSSFVKNRRESSDLSGENTSHIEKLAGRHPLLGASRQPGAAFLDRVTLCGPLDVYCLT